MLNLDTFIKRFPDPVIEDSATVYRGYTPYDYITAPAGFRDVEDLCEYPYRVIWVSEEHKAILEYCEHDIKLALYNTDNALSEAMSDALWYFAIPERIKQASEIFIVKHRKNEKSGYEESWYATRSNNTLTRKLMESEIKVDEFHYQWADGYLKGFHERYCDPQYLPELRKDRSKLDEWLCNIELHQICYNSEHLEWLQREDGRWNVDEVLEGGIEVRSLTDLCLEAERIEQNEIMDIIRAFLEWLIFDYEEDLVLEFTSSDVCNSSIPEACSVN
jgi:hypothetical protein